MSRVISDVFRVVSHVSRAVSHVSSVISYVSRVVSHVSRDASKVDPAIGNVVRDKNNRDLTPRQVFRATAWVSCWMDKTRFRSIWK